MALGDVTSHPIAEGLVLESANDGGVSLKARHDSKGICTQCFTWRRALTTPAESARFFSYCFGTPARLGIESALIPNAQCTGIKGYK
jgi:hypothetical protein